MLNFLTTILFSLTLAQIPPELIVTWRAFSYAPPDYTGKILPTKKTLVTAAVEALERNKLADLNQKEVRWYLDNQFLGGGRGLKNISFRVPAVTSRDPLLRVTIDNQDKFVSLPLAEPEAVIINPVTLQARPYFFNIERLNELDWRWQKDEKSLKVFVQKRTDHLEFAKSRYGLP